MDKFIRTFIASLLILGFLFPWRADVAASRGVPQSAVATSPSGSLDPTFGTGGYVSTNLFAWAAMNPIVEQPDGKIIAIGDIFYQNNLHTSRYHRDGSLDTTFGSWGEVYTTDPMASSAVALQSDGKVLIAGSVYNSTSDFALLRLNQNGSLDTGFGTNGKVTTDFAINDDQGYAVIEQPDHKILVAGNVYGGVSVDFGLVRYASNGSLDTGFGTNGKVTTDFGGDGHIHIDEVRAIALQEDNKILVAGESYYYTGGITGFFALARYNTDGSLDAGFGSGGKVTTGFGSGYSIIRAVAVQPDHAILVGGSTASPGGGSFTLARYTENGALDTSFGTGGLVTTDFGGNEGEACIAISLGTPGKIRAAGWSSVYTGGIWTYSVALAQYNLDGSPDGSFGTDGKVKADFNNARWIIGFAFLQDGMVLVAGVNDSGYALGRYSSAGSLDLTLNTRTSFNIGTYGTGDPISMALQPDDKILVAGTVEVCTLNSGQSRLYPQDRNPASGPAGVCTFDFALARLNTEGSLDTTFGANGIVTTDFAARKDVPSAVAVQPDGKIIVVGSSGGYIALARYTSAGSLDAGFGANGLILLNLAGAGRAVAVQPDGKIVIAGTSGTDFVVLRLNSNGDPDTSFGGYGYELADFEGSDYGNALALQPDGKIVVAGYTDQANQKAVALVRYNPDGTVDKIDTFDFDSLQGEVVYSVGLQPDGKIVVGGYAYYYVSPAYHMLFLARFTTDLEVDPTFGTDGRVTTQANPIAGYAVANVPMSVRPDGKIALAANSALVQYDRDGSLDLDFSEDGKVASIYLTAIAYQADGKIVGGDIGFNNTYEEVKLVRYESTYTPPTITSFSPIIGGVGTGVIITGTNFTGATEVAFNGVAASYSVISETNISATVPALATSGPLRVTTPNGIGLSSSNFTVMSVNYLPFINH